MSPDQRSTSLETVRLLPEHSEVSASASPRILNRPHSITALVYIPDQGAEGLLVSQGGVNGGFSFYLADHRLHYVESQEFVIVGDVVVSPGEHALTAEFDPT